MGGKLIRYSLKTDKLGLAQLRLGDLVKEERARVETRAEAGKGRMTFGDALQIYRNQLEANADFEGAAVGRTGQASRAPGSTDGSLKSNGERGWPDARSAPASPLTLLNHLITVPKEGGQVDGAPRQRGRLKASCVQVRLIGPGPCGAR